MPEETARRAIDDEAAGEGGGDRQALEFGSDALSFRKHAIPRFLERLQGATVGGIYVGGDELLEFPVVESANEVE